MAAKKMNLKIVQTPDEKSFNFLVEDFISQITNPETMQIQFEVAKTNAGTFSFFAFILFDGELTKRAI